MNMQTKQIPYGSICILLLLLFLCVLFAGSIRQEMLETVTRCLTVIIPSLYAMMILAQMLIATGIWRILAKPFRRITPRLLGMPDACFALFLLSQFAGYPVGASMISTLHQNGTLSQKDASRLLCVCYGSGPAFLLGLLGTQWQIGACFALIFISNVLANFIVAVVLFHWNPIQLQNKAKSQLLHPLDASILVESTAKAGRTLLRLCGIILCFSAACAILESLGFFQAVAFLTEQLNIPISLTPICKSILEISNTTQLSLPFSYYLPILAGLISFGGFCVILQIYAVAGKIASMRTFLPIRLLTALLSTFFCRIGMFGVSWNFPIDTPMAIAPAVSPSIHKNAIFPVCMLLVMMLLLFREEHRLHSTIRISKDI